MNAPSAALRTVFEDLGFHDVQTVISSGNVIFSSPEQNVPALAQRIETALAEQLNVTSIAIILSAEQIQQFVATAPFGNQQHSKKTYLTVTFMKNPASAAQCKPYLYYDATTRALCNIHNTEHAKTPDIMAKLEKEFGKQITTRTWNTVVKISQKF